MNKSITRSPDHPITRFVRTEKQTRTPGVPSPADTPPLGLVLDLLRARARASLLAHEAQTVERVEDAGVLGHAPRTARRQDLQRRASVDCVVVAPLLRREEVEHRVASALQERRRAAEPRDEPADVG